MLLLVRLRIYVGLEGIVIEMLVAVFAVVPPLHFHPLFVLQLHPPHAISIIVRLKNTLRECLFLDVLQLLLPLAFLSLLLPLLLLVINFALPLPLIVPQILLLCDFCFGLSLLQLPLLDIQFFLGGAAQ